MLRHHADAIPLAETADELLLEPGKLKAGPFDFEHLGHVAADHPADVYASLLLAVGAHVGLLPRRPAAILPPVAASCPRRRTTYQMPLFLPRRVARTTSLAADSVGFLPV